MRQIRLLQLITALVFLTFISPGKVLASKLVRYDVNAPSVIVRDVSLGVAIMGGVALLASGALLIAYAVEDGRFKDRFKRIGSDEDAQTLNPSYDSLEMLYHMTVVAGAVGMTELSLGLIGYFWGKSLVDAKHRSSYRQLHKSHLHKKTYIFGQFGG